MSIHAYVCVQVCKDIMCLHVDMGGKRTFICVEEGTRGRTQWTKTMEQGLKKITNPKFRYYDQPCKKSECNNL